MIEGRTDDAPKPSRCFLRRPHFSVQRHVAAAPDSNPDTLQSLTAFDEFSAMGLDDDEPIWSEAYLDAFGLGLVSSITMPIFLDRGHRGNPPRCFLGLAGHDVIISADDQAELEELTTELANSRKCLSKGRALDVCRLQALRADHSQCQARLQSSKCYSFTNIAGVPSTYTIPESDAGGGDLELLGFEAATERCSQMGGSLAVIGSRETQQFLSGIVPPDRSWIGLRRSNASGEWEWADGGAVDEEVSSRIWLDGKAPGDGEGAGGCAALGPGSTSRNVRAAQCGEKLSFVCEIAEGGAVCEGATSSISYKGLTKTHNAANSDMECEPFDDCGFPESPVVENALCPLGERGGDTCCECVNG
eukprot:evm.model.scf_319EXC.9 EVM.evm.TU.scf_319EXC.9   scf_319EXC:72616-76137(-)